MTFEKLVFIKTNYNALVHGSNCDSGPDTRPAWDESSDDNKASGGSK